MRQRTGTAVWVEKENRWRISIKKDGIRRVFYSSTPGRKGQREANAKADAWLDDNIDNQTIKVRTAFNQYIDGLKLTTAKDHYRQYEGYGKNHILPLIGNVRVSNLNEQHLQNIIDKAYNKSKLSKKTLQNMRACLTQFVKYCRKNKWTTLFPESLIIPKSATPPDKNILQPDDLKKLFACNNTMLRNVVRPELYVYAWRFEAVTGLRPGEIIGLRWSDIIGDIVHVQRSINRSGDITTGKNDNARRSFKLYPLLQQILRSQRELMQENNIVSDYVFCNEYGEFIPQATYYKRWCRYRDFNNIAGGISPYELRHTFVSIVKSLPPGIIKQLVGHSQNMDTFGVYSHDVIGDIDTAAELTADAVNAVLFDAKSDEE